MRSVAEPMFTRYPFGVPRKTSKEGKLISEKQRASDERSMRGLEQADPEKFKRRLRPLSRSLKKVRSLVRSEATQMSLRVMDSNAMNARCARARDEWDTFVRS